MGVQARYRLALLRPGHAAPVLVWPYGQPLPYGAAHHTHIKGHDMTRTIEPGTLIIDHAGHEYIWAGTADMEGMTSITFGIGRGGPSEMRCDPDMVAPAHVAGNVNLKDPRITVLKYDKKPYAWVPGPWCHDVELPDGTHHTGWHKTKRDGTAEAAHRLAIADWHAAGARLGYLRMQIEAENISYAEIAELQGLASQIDPGDVQLLEWAAVEDSPAK